MICSPWLDRLLSVAGRIVVKTENGVETRLVKVDRDLLIIPNLAIHMNRSVNDGYEFNACLLYTADWNRPTALLQQPEWRALWGR